MLSRIIAAYLIVIVPAGIASPSDRRLVQGRPSSEAAVRFEAASVRESLNSNDRVQPYSVTPGGVTMRKRTVVQMMQWAYDLPERDIVGGPNWARTRLFDVVARTSDPAATAAPLRMMMRNLLTERFALDAVFERGVRPVYALTLKSKDGKLGSEMHPSTAKCDRLPSEGAPLPGVEFQRAIESRYCGISIASGQGVVYFVSGMRATTGDLARGLSRYLDRPVLDRTGLTAEFDFRLIVTPPTSAAFGAGAPTGTVPGPSSGAGGEIFTGIQEQLGLKLDPDRGETEVLMILKVDPPTEN